MYRTRKVESLKIKGETLRVLKGIVQDS